MRKLEIYGGMAQAMATRHLLSSIPPTYSVAHVIGYLKGKGANHLARVYGGRKRSFVGWHFWARGFPVLTVCRDETVLREYIRNQEQEVCDWSR